MDTFHSRDAAYRSPFGAVSAGTEVRFSVRPPADRFPLRAFLCYTPDGGATHEMTMEKKGEAEGRVLFSCGLKTTEVGLIWYYFRFENDGGSFYYGNNPAQTGGRGAWSGGTEPPAFQLTVYAPELEVPAWFGEGVIYHIFPDRYHRTAVPDAGDYPSRPGYLGRTVHKNWADLPSFHPHEVTGEVENRDFFGGNLAGVREKLPYIKSLGVTCIYFSPIFEAYSNHRYDTGDYLKVDPMFGTNEEFEVFCAEAGAMGIRVILDGVFNHTGDDSRYFNRRGTYEETGAYQSTASPYYPWYTFERHPDRYSSWWGIETLPQTNEQEPSYLEFIAGGEDAVIRRWLRAGASGWRLDVADELPDVFIQALFRAARAEKADAVLIGEVWEDASNKISYDKRRRYILGGALDGVMNYPFRQAVLAFLGGGPAERFREAMEQLRENYPWPVLCGSMNLLGTHDTARVLTVLGSTVQDYTGSKEDRAYRMLPEGRREQARDLLKLGALLQFVMPGAPVVYYGDEAGMEGYEDPLNRRGFPWGREDAELVRFYKRLGAARGAIEALKRGSITYLTAEGPLLVIERRAEGRAVAVVSRHDAARTICLDWEGETAAEFLSGALYPVENGRLIVTVPPRTGLLFYERPRD
ncbi:glycoside hydrolase family 13 protein [Oscillospiraceae bacterium OttesenSCG-928-F05]|nr:glycoside hydrolase family 13 protein [Oscillospiraceae bacterium OttesenSCG-928-F05]